MKLHPKSLLCNAARACVWLMNMPPLLWGGRLKRHPGILLEPGYSLPLEQQYQVCALLAAPLEFLVVGLQVPVVCLGATRLASAPCSGPVSLCAWSSSYCSTLCATASPAFFRESW